MTEDGACAVIFRGFNRSTAVSDLRDPFTVPCFLPSQTVYCDLLDMMASLSLYQSASLDDRGRPVHENCFVPIVLSETRTHSVRERKN